MDLNTLKRKVENVKLIPRDGRNAAKAAELAVLWDFVSDIAENGDASLKEKANYLLESGMRSVNNGKINLQDFAKSIAGSFDHLKNAAKDGTLKIEKKNGCITTTAGTVTFKCGG